MWYIFGTRWIDTPDEGAARVYKIGHATSEDGINWIKEEGKQIIPSRLNEHECQALPTVLFHKDRYHMYFCYREATGFRKDKTRGYRLGYAWSDDLQHWTRAVFFWENSRNTRTYNTRNRFNRKHSAHQHSSGVTGTGKHLNLIVF